MEVTTTYYVRRLLENQRVVTAAVHLDLQAILGIYYGLKSWPMNLRNAFQRVRILNVIVMYNWFAFRQQLSHDLSNGTLAWMHSNSLNRGTESQGQTFHRKKSQSTNWSNRLDDGDSFFQGDGANSTYELSSINQGKGIFGLEVC